MQNGANVCATGGAPDRCDASCALAFIPYYTHCIEQAPHAQPGPVSTQGDLQVFSDLFSQCTEHLPANETSILLSIVMDRDDEPTCSIDTDSIKTLTEAKMGPPSCETDSSEMCSVLIQTGTYTCAESFCLVCDQAHTCDHTCELPCGHPSSPPAVCDDDASDMCSTLIASGAMSCGSDFCATCSDAGTCDHSCELPCSTDAESSGTGAHRLLVESGHSNNMFPQFFLPTTSCAWDTLDDTVLSIERVCCAAEEDSCANGLPELCSYGCGRQFVPFLDQCGPKLAHIITNENALLDFDAFKRKCLQLDPKTMVLAIDRAVCTSCGDGEFSANEDCDDGERNSDAPNAHCRLDCHLGRCGDGVLDTDRGEECDLGALNMEDATEENQCTSDCTVPSIRGSFAVVSGPCTLTEDSRCVGREHGYLPNERCEIVVVDAGTLGSCPLFDIQGSDGLNLHLTEENIFYYDTITNNNLFTAENCPAGAVL
eukprot:SAG31_NODE_5466_length_2523_cov_1.370875_1_plen_483_part_10